MDAEMAKMTEEKRQALIKDGWKENPDGSWVGYPLGMPFTKEQAAGKAVRHIYWQKAHMAKAKAEGNQ